MLPVFSAVVASARNVSHHIPQAISSCDTDTLSEATCGANAWPYACHNDPAVAEGCAASCLRQGDTTCEEIMDFVNPKEGFCGVDANAYDGCANAWHHACTTDSDVCSRCAKTCLANNKASGMTCDQVEACAAAAPAPAPTAAPTPAPTAAPTPAPAAPAPTPAPTAAPTPAPTAAPTPAPTAAPTPAPAAPAPTPAPTAAPTPAPTAAPTPAPTAAPTPAPTTKAPAVDSSFSCDTDTSTTIDCTSDAWGYNCTNLEGYAEQCAYSCKVHMSISCDEVNNLAKNASNSAGGAGSGVTGQCVDGCCKGPAAGQDYVGYVPEPDSELDGEIRWSDSGHVEVIRAPKLRSCASAVMPEAGKTYTFDEYYSALGAAKLNCAGWTQSVHNQSKALSEKNSGCALANNSGAYEWTAFARAAGMFRDFANSSEMSANQLEIAAFVANTSKETTGGYNGNYSGWSYCFLYELGYPTTSYGSQANYEACKNWDNFVVGTPVDNEFADARMNQGYYGRGSFQLSYCYNYRWFNNWVNDVLGKPLTYKTDFVTNPGFVADEWAFESGLWFWMSRESGNNKPSMHSVVADWRPSTPLDTDNAGRSNDFGYTVNIINGGVECGNTSSPSPKIRVDYFEEYMGYMNVDTSLYRANIAINGGCAGQSDLGSNPFYYWNRSDGTKDGGDTANVCE